MSKYSYILFLVFFAFASILPAKSQYDEFFTPKRFRFDYYIAGSNDSAYIIPDKLHEEPEWSGSKKNLVDTFRYGEMFFRLLDPATKTEIFSKGYSNLFIEWQTTPGAKDTMAKYHECITFPAPLRPVVLEIFMRDTTMAFNRIFEYIIDPEANNINRTGFSPQTKSKLIHNGNESHHALDIVFLSEGYTESQCELFYTDVERYKNYLFGWEPYKHYRQSINILAVFSASAGEGADMPGQNFWVETIAGAHFSTFGIERYLTLPNICKVYEHLAAYPVDQVCVLVNSNKYGGGGIYNFYTIFTSACAGAEMLFMHEFGHGFASLADEYFNSEVPYIEFGSRNFEPYQPNITNMANFSSKWAGMINDTVPVPTPDIPEYDNTVGVFEGAFYNTKGFYRPQRNCAMRSSGTKRFCKVCEAAIEEMLRFSIE